MAPTLEEAIRYHRVGRLGEAEWAYAAILAENPRSADAHHLLGVVHHQRGRYEEARRSIDAAIAIDDRRWAFHSDLGCILDRLGAYEESLACYEHALRLAPTSALARNNYGSALQRLGFDDEAVICYRQAIALDPAYPQPHCNLGHLARDRGDPDGALAAYERALSIDPGCHEARANRGLVLLQKEDFAAGWSEYDARLAIECDWTLARQIGCDLWDGAPLAEKTLLVHREQGIGDEIMYASCYPDLVQSTSGAIAIVCNPRLARLLARSLPAAIVRGAELRPEAASAPDFGRPIDRQVFAASVPRYLRQRLSDFPSRLSFLRPDPDQLAHWKSRFGALGPGLRVGISWAGGSRPEHRRMRSIDLAAWRPLLTLPGVEFINLQYGDCQRQLLQVEREYRVVVHDWAEGGPLGDIDDFAARVAALDLVISVDNSTVHLAGALGVETWALLGHAANWRWGMSRERSLWYPTVRLLRQLRPGDWAGPIEQARQLLAAHRLATHRRTGG